MSKTISKLSAITICSLVLSGLVFNNLQTVNAGPVATVVVSEGSAHDWFVTGTGVATAKDGDWIIDDVSCSINREDDSIVNSNCVTPTDGTYDEASEDLTIDADIYQEPPGNYYIELYTDEYSPGGENYDFSDTIIIPFTLDENGNGAFDLSGMPGLKVVIDSGPTIVGNDVTIEGHGESQGGDFYINDFEVYLDTNFYDWLTPVDGVFDEATEEFVLEFNDLTPGDYMAEIHVWETDGNTTNNTHGTGAYVINFTVPPAGAVLTVSTGPTVTDDDMTITGSATARDSGWQIVNFYYTIPGYSSGTIDATDGSYDGEQTEEFDLTISDMPNDDYTIEIYAEEYDGNATYADSNTASEPFTVNVLPQNGDIQFTLSAPSIPANTSFITYSGSVTDNHGFNIAEIFYMSGDPVQVEALDGSFDEPTEEFEFTRGPLPNGNYGLQIYAENTLATQASAVFTPSPQVINNTSPMASCTLSNHATPTTDNTPTHTVTCSSNDTIYSIEYKINNDVGGNLVPWTTVPQEDLTSGTYNVSTSVTASITPDITLQDGNTSIMINAYTGTGRRLGTVAENVFSFSTPLPIDVFVIEAVDDSAPTIKLNPILPDPITSTAPYITGSCQDVHEFDTNSTINSLQYRIDAGSWISITPLNAPLDNAIENFSFQLPEQALGSYSLTVRCGDTSGNDTNTEGTNQTLQFEIIAQPDVEPEEVIVTENFTTNALNSVNETTAIWGNGYIRLKEKITFEKELLDSTGFVDRYGSVFSAQFSLTGSATDIWYAVDYGGTNFGLRRYNKNSGITTNYTNLSGVRIWDIEYFTSGGNEYILFTDSIPGLSILEVGSGIVTEITTAPGVNSAREIYRDPRNNNFGFYVHNGTPNNIADSNLYYIDLNGTPTNAGDDQLEWYDTKPGFDFDSIHQFLIDGDNNIAYASQFGVGIHAIRDGGTPLNIADDVITTYTTTDHDDLNRLSGMAKDPNDDGVFIITHDVESKLIYLDVNGTPGNPADDDMIELANASDLHQQRIDNITFVEGPQYVGGQMFMLTRTGKIVYYNTNGTYGSNTDDTAIFLETNEGLYPEYISDIYMSDYNTIYANFQHTGMSKIDLNRSWENTGDAVTISIPPEVRLIVNNINLEDVIVGPLLEDFDGTTEPNNGEVGIQYFVSIDDGVTYEELSVGELKNVLEEDYRLKLKITLTKIGTNSKTPIINGFTLAYGAYEAPIAPGDLDSLDITVSPTSFNINTNFNITVRALDSLGYPIAAIDDAVALQLKDFDSSANVNALTPVSMNFVDGVATTNTAQISESGSYKITATYEAETVDSVELTVGDGGIADPDPDGVTPTLNFYTDKSSIQKGETAILTWNTTNAASVVISDYGSVPVNGTLSVSPEVTTTYYITVTDSEGDTLTSSLTIVVNTSNGTGSSAPVSGTTGDGDEEQDELILEVADDYIEVLKGNKVTISWTTEGNPDSVYVDYLGRDGTSSGSFEFIPERDIVITITATRGDQTITRTITIKVIGELPNIYLPAIVAATGILTSSILTGSIAQYFSIFLGLVLFRKRKYWGIIYNSDKLVPIPFVTIRVYRTIANSKEFVAQTTSDLEGRYGIPIGASGNYQVEFLHEKYRTEIKDLLIQQNSDIVLDVGMDEANTDGHSLMNRIRIFFKENAPVIMQWLRVALIALMVAGAYITLQVIKLSPLPINYIVLLLYLAAIVTQVIVLLSPYINMKRGKVVEIKSKSPVKGAVFRILGDNQKATQGVESLSFTNEYGVVKIRIGSGKYAYQVSKPGYDANSGSMLIDESGRITETIYMNKGSGQFGS